MKRTMILLALLTGTAIACCDEPYSYPCPSGDGQIGYKQTCTDQYLVDGHYSVCTYQHGGQYRHSWTVTFQR